MHQLFCLGEYKSQQQVEEEFGVSILRFNALKKALPKEWVIECKEVTQTVFQPIKPHGYDVCLHAFHRGFSQKVYRFLSNDIMLVHNKYIKWMQELGQDFSEGILDFAQDFMNIYKVTNVAKFRSFQYRLLHRAIITNIQLFNWGIKSHNLCSFCLKEEETLGHLFVECPIIKELWRKIYVYIREEYCTTEISMSASNVIKNKLVEKKGHVINFICLISKQYIYAQRCLGRDVSFPALKAYIMRIKSIEKYIAQKNGKMRVHKMKWEKEVVGSTDELSLSQYVVDYFA